MTVGVRLGHARSRGLSPSIPASMKDSGDSKDQQLTVRRLSRAPSVARTQIPPPADRAGLSPRPLRPHKRTPGTRQGDCQRTFPQSWCQEGGRPAEPEVSPAPPLPPHLPTGGGPPAPKPVPMGLWDKTAPPSRNTRAGLARLLEEEGGNQAVPQPSGVGSELKELGITGRQGRASRCQGSWHGAGVAGDWVARKMLSK